MFYHAEVANRKDGGMLTRSCKVLILKILFENRKALGASNFQRKSENMQWHNILIQRLTAPAQAYLLFATVHTVTNLRAALARLPHSPSCGGFLYLLVGSTGCGGNARGFEEGI